MATRREVARAANVSVRTVSNVVNGFDHVAPDTRERVLRAIEELEYRPSELARSLKVGRSGLVGLMLPELDTAYFAELTRAFVEGGAERGLTVVVDQTDGDHERELALLHRTSTGSLFDALVLSPLALRADDVAGFSAGPLVFLGEDEFPGFDKVMIDNFRAAYEAVDHLVQQGRRRIAAIGAERAAHGSSALRLEGYRAALRAGGRDLPEIVEYVSGFRRPEGAAAMRRLLDGPDRPDAVFCFSDPLALGALRTLYEAHVSVPDDVAVVGWDDIEDGRFATPSLTTVSPDKKWLARTALDRIVRRLSGEELPGEVLVGPHRLIVRESSPTA
ncbi:LacI family DNA-binding transcriptional regulator [Cellulomonas sp. SG140]|uniref:LacI family DNA-binding transcriptional regulator n=1 Tax=Cellulomonas sp. SG140 TaxID=2976536 RepID=UPI0021E925EE|nr:LacI family DNA-binding transcriptional regulator [Cellulomonas sp. SG140]